MSEPPDTASTSRPEIEALRERLRSGRLGQEDLQLLDRLLGTLLNLINLLQQKNASLSRLKRLLFGPRSKEQRTPFSGRRNVVTPIFRWDTIDRGDHNLPTQDRSRLLAERDALSSQVSRCRKGHS